MTEWGPKTCVAILAGSIAFVLAGALVLMMTDDAQMQLGGVAVMAFFGGGIPLSLLEIRKHARKQYKQGIGRDLIGGFAAMRVEALAFALTASGMAFGSYMLQYMKPEKPFIGIISWAGACLFGAAALLIIAFGFRSKDNQ